MITQTVHQKEHNIIHAFSDHWAVTRKAHPRVLMVEDSPESQVIVELGLRDWDAQIDIAEDGFEAVEKMLSGPKWDLIILDWKLPGLNGLRTLSYVEEVMGLDTELLDRWGFEKVPVIVYTSLALDDYEFEDFDHFKVVDLWEKPISPRSIRSRMSLLMSP